MGTENSFHEKLMAVLIITVILDVNIHVIEGADKQIFVRCILGKHNLMLHHRISIASDDTTFKPSHYFADDWKVIVDGKK